MVEKNIKSLPHRKSISGNIKYFHVKSRFNSFIIIDGRIFFMILGQEKPS